jgi:putative hydrolase of the HAD superfamily
VIAPGKSTSSILGVSRDQWNEQLLKNSQDRLRGELTDPFLIIKRMAHQIDRSIKDQTIRLAVKTRCERFRFALEKIDPDVVATLERIKSLNMKLGLISNADVMEIAAWPDSPINKLFDCAVFSSEVGFIKPEKEIFELCFKQLGIKPAGIVYAGDGGSDELRAARDLGMTTVLVIHVIKTLWPERIPERRKYADHEIDRISGIIELLNGGIE